MFGAPYFGQYLEDVDDAPREPSEIAQLQDDVIDQDAERLQEDQP